MEETNKTTENNATPNLENPKETIIEDGKEKVETNEEDEDFDLTDELLNDVEKCRNSKLNLTEGEREDQDEDFGGEMNDMFQKVMGQFGENMQNPGENQEGDMAGMMDNMTQMLQQMMGQDGGFDPKMMNPEEAEKMMGGNTEGGNMDAMADNLLRQLMDKQILYEPFSQAKVELKKYIEEKKDKLDPQLLDRHEKQYVQISTILDLFDKEPDNKDQLMKEFDNLQKLGDFPAEQIEKNPGLTSFLPPKADSKEEDMKMPPNMPPNFEQMFKMDPNQAKEAFDGKGVNDQDCCIF